MLAFNISRAMTFAEERLPAEDPLKSVFEFVLMCNPELFLEKDMCSKTLRTGVARILKKEGVITLKDLIAHSPKQLWMYRGMGFKRVCYIQASLQKHGFELDEGGEDYLSCPSPFGAKWRTTWFRRKTWFNAYQ
jgi:hypothetical protein